MEKDIIIINGMEYDVFYFKNPMFHEDWHTVDLHNLVYVEYQHVGPDYWDDCIMFCKEKDKKVFEKWKNENRLWW